MLRRLLLGMGLLILLGNIQVAAAHDVLQGDQCTVDVGQRIEGNVFALCRMLTVSGEIDGDLFGGAGKILIDGTVDGSLYLVGGQLDISGQIGQDIHFAGGALNVSPSATFSSERGDLISATLSTEVEGTHLTGSVTSVSYQLVLSGSVQREVSFWGSALAVNGLVNGDVTATVGDPASTGVTELRTLFNFLPLDVTLVNPGLRVTNLGMINGQLRYSGPVEGEIAPVLPHTPIFTPVVSQPDFTLTSPKGLLDSLRDYAAQAVREFVSLSLVGVLGLLFIPRTLQAPIYSLRVRPLPSLGVGLLTFIISFPVFLIVILLSLALMLVLSVVQLGDLALLSGLIINVINVGGAGVFYFIAIFVSRVIVCLGLGSFLIRLLFGERSERTMSFASLLLGVILLALAASLPYVGFAINGLAAFLGLGAILTLVQRQIDRAREAAPPEPTHSEEARQLPPPAISDQPALGPGMDNLPGGFKWWK